MRYLHHVSVLILVSGVILVILGETLNFGASITLVGLLLVIAGVVKFVTVRIWRGVFDLDVHAEEERGT